MKPVLCLGSLNIDFTYRVPHLVRPGETLAATDFIRGAGGKGLNQSLAVARAGAEVSHVGKIGADGVWLRDLLAGDGVKSEAVRTTTEATGHANIQVAESGENAIVLFAGANLAITPEDVSAAIANADSGSIFLTQNETSGVPEALLAAARRGLTVVFNPAPFSAAVRTYPLEHVDYLIVNETEAEALSPGGGDGREVAGRLAAEFPRACVVVTAGAAGACAVSGGRVFPVPACPVKAVDTTAAGDVFVGYFVAGVARGYRLESALTLAAQAAALSVTRMGAAASIPTFDEVERFIAARAG